MARGAAVRATFVGRRLSIERDNDKNPVVALREIADTTSTSTPSPTASSGPAQAVETEEAAGRQFGTGDTDILSDLSQTVDEPAGRG